MAIIDPIDLSFGTYSARILPRFGGQLAWLRWQGMDLLNALPDGVSEPKPSQLSMFPMTPFAGRVENAGFTWRGKTYELTPHTDEPHALHGTGWLAAWNVAAQTECSVLLEHEGVQGPLAHLSRLEYRLGEKGLTTELSVTSRADEPLPFGIGLHPWFKRPGAKDMRFSARRFWLDAPGGIPSDSITLPPELDHSRGGPAFQHFRNNCWEGWEGEVLVSYPGEGFATRMTASENLDWLMCFNPPTMDAFCLEPQSHLPAAHNKSGEGAPFGLVELAPGETLSGTVHFEAMPLARA